MAQKNNFRFCHSERSEESLSCKAETLRCAQGDTEVIVLQLLSGGLTKYTEYTPGLLADVYEDLRITRERGFAISEQEYEQDINAVAAPILATDGIPVAVIAVAGPSYRLPRERLLTLGQSIWATTNEIAREMGLSSLSAFISNTVVASRAG